MRTAAVLFSVLAMTMSSSVAFGADGDRVDRTRPKTSKSSKATKPKPTLTDSRIRKILIQESIAAYSGNCPCPYNTASNGSSCGGRSAWSRAGGEEPLCYPKDVSSEMVREYRDSHPDEQAEPEVRSEDNRAEPSASRTDGKATEAERGKASPAKTASR